MTVRLSGWGRFPVAECNVVRPRSEAALLAALAGAPAIARGMGRAYGDSALNPHATIDMTAFRHMLSFDAHAGVLVAEAGVTLGEIIEAFLSRGWFVPVTPGTKFVSLGGAIAADVHGKNHHKHGSFGGFVEWIDVVGADGEIRRCSRKENADLFAWTIGGMGLTGDHPARRPAPAARRERLDPPAQPSRAQSRRGHGGVRGERPLDLFRRVDRLPRQRR